MNLEIKERIELIKNGIVPEGYEFNKSGIIPKNWSFIKLESAASNQGDYGLNEAAVPYDANLPKYLRITDIDDYGRYINNDVSVDFDRNIDYIVNDNDILLARTGASTGKSYLYNQSDGELAFAGFLIRFNFSPQQYNSIFAKNIFGSKRYWDWVKVTSQRSGQPGINAKEYCGFLLQSPPLEEQQKIASILSTWDKAIDLQKKLIEQKQEQKRGLMQRLLTDVVRLSGFNDEWKEVRLGDVTTRVTRKNTINSTNVLTISAQQGMINQEKYFNKSVASSILDNYFLLKRGEFAYNKSYSNGYPMGAIKRLNTFDIGVVTTLYICFSLKDFSKSNSDFFEQYFESGLLNNKIKQIAHEGGRAHGLLNVTPNDFFKLEFKIPHIAEQNAIANILTTVDDEIKLLQTKLNGFEEQKRGLMQLLLTGIVRVKV